MASHVWHPFTPMAEGTHLMRIVRGDGNYLIDEQGARYFDGVSSLWTNVHGHNHPLLNEALVEQSRKISHSTLLGLSNLPSAELAARLVGLAPRGLAHVFYSDSGSTAVEVALKQAFQFWQLVGRPQKQHFVHLEHGYHGDTLGAVSVGGIEVFHQIFKELTFFSQAIPSPAARTWDESGDRMSDSLAALDRILDESADSIAAVIVEPLVQGAGGILVHPAGFLRAVSERCRAADVLLIVDEVATGFGRTGTLFACEQESVEPDLMCLAKGITGGYLPLAATLSTSRIFEAFLGRRNDMRTFFHGHTYTGNALACAVANANLDVFEKEGTLARQPGLHRVMRRACETLKNDPWVSHVRQCGLMVGVELRPKSAATSDPDFALGHEVCLAIRRHGVILRNLGDVVVMMPPLSSTEDQICTMATALAAAIVDVREAQ